MNNTDQQIQPIKVDRLIVDQCFIASCVRKILQIRQLNVISNNLMGQRKNQLPVEKEIRKRRWRRIGSILRKSSNCITIQGLTWNPRDNGKGRSKKTLHRESESNIRRMNSTWKQVESRAQERVGWRLLFSDLCSARSKRRN